MKKRLLLVLVLGMSFAQPVLGASTGQQSMNDTLASAGSGVLCQEGLMRVKAAQAAEAVDPAQDDARKASAAIAAR